MGGISPSPRIIAANESEAVFVILVFVVVVDVLQGETVAAAAAAAAAAVVLGFANTDFVERKKMGQQPQFQLRRPIPATSVLYCTWKRLLSLGKIILP